MTLTLKKIINNYDNIDTYTPIRKSTIVMIVMASLLIGAYVSVKYEQIPEFYKFINNTANSGHILTDGTNVFYIAPYHLMDLGYDTNNVSEKQPYDHVRLINNSDNLTLEIDYNDTP